MFLPMKVSIVQEWHFPDSNEQFTKFSADNSIFYIVKLRKGNHRFLKVGMTRRTAKERFSDKDYRDYSAIEIIYVAEVTCKKTPKMAGQHVEELTKCALRETSGFTFVPNDRFQYFQLPEEIPVYTNLTNHKMVSLRR